MDRRNALRTLRNDTQSLDPPRGMLTSKAKLHESWTAGQGTSQIPCLSRIPTPHSRVESIRSNIPGVCHPMGPWGLIIPGFITPDSELDMKADDETDWVCSIRP